MSWTLETELARIDTFDLTGRQRQALEALGCRTLADFWFHLPRRYENRIQFESFPNQPMDRAVCVCGIVADIGARFAGGRRHFAEARIESEDPGAFAGPLICRWFQMPWILKALAVDQKIVLYGKPKMSGRRLVMDHPEFEIVDDASTGVASVHLGRIVPVYPLVSGITQRTVRELHYQVCQATCQQNVPNIAPDASRAEARWRALQDVHFPDSMEAVQAAHRYLAFEEFMQLQLTVLWRRREYREKQGAAHCGEGRFLDQFLQRLEFEPTKAQRRAVADIRDDLAVSRPMNRLLQGDVGSGKTLVAVCAMLLAVESGSQAALMAPTQLLAEQHYEGLRRWLEPLGLRVGLRTATRTEDGFLPLMAGGEEAQILVGTHALLYEKVEIGALGLIVIDEQHKFGVLQRGRLMERATLPDVLVMTATPIPRTLTMTFYGDLDVSVLDEVPKGRGKLVTALRPETKTPEAATFLREQVEKGGQAYIVYPLIEDSEKVKAKSATAAFDEWRQRLPGLTCELLHGRLSAEEKETVMRRFRRGETKVLVSTTVIEVGVDVPAATIMLIYHAERFGLAQLHQLRGRIGRGSAKSYCILMSGSEDEEALSKLAVLVETRDGFRIAEADLARRGPGDLLGTAQSGLEGLRFAEFLADLPLVTEARKAAERLLAEDPFLEAPEHTALREGVGLQVKTLANVG